MSIVKHLCCSVSVVCLLAAAPPAEVEGRIDQLLARMTLDEKIGQMSQGLAVGNALSESSRREIREGRWGSFLNTGRLEDRAEAQRIALKESRLGIPLIFGQDVIHGYRTVLPIPDRRLVDITGYQPAFSQYRELPVTNIFTTRGCPFQCIFCVPDLLGKKVRFRSVDKVVEEIEYLRKDFGIKEIAFWDDTFTLNRVRALEISRRLAQLSPRLVWSAQARADKVDAELLKAMADAGCWKLHFGFESMVQKNLDFLRKGTTVEQNMKTILQQADNRKYAAQSILMSLVK